jgi:hypothetical protein
MSAEPRDIWPTAFQAGREAALAEVAAWLEDRLEGERRPGACVTVNLGGFERQFDVTAQNQIRQPEEGTK